MRSHITLRGFTIIELLAVMAIISVLIALLLPAVQSARAAASRLQCQNRLHQLGLALHNYHDVHRVLPAGSYALGPSFRTQSGWGWGAMMLPYLEQAPLYQVIDFHVGTAVGANREVIRTPLPFWRCPADIAPDGIIAHLGGELLSVAAGNYCGVKPVLSEMSATRFRDVTDGLSQTLFVGERVYQPSVSGSLEFTSSWIGKVAAQDEMIGQSIPHLEATTITPINDSLDDPTCFTSRHTGGAQFTFGDGSTRFLNENMDVEIFEALGTPSGGEAVSF